jgi:lysophospholipase L1-like esterase
MNPDKRSIATRLRLLACGLLFVVVCLGWYYDAFLRHPQGDGPVAIPMAPIRTNYLEPSVLVGMGDSVTAGFGARKGWGYFDRLYEAPEGDWPDVAGSSLHKRWPNLMQTNIAISGSISIQHEVLIDRLPMYAGRGIVVMTSGGNDLIHAYGKAPPREGAMYGATLEQAGPWIAAFEKRYERMINKINAHFTNGCEIYIATIYDPSDGTGGLRYTGLPYWPDGVRILAAYNDIIRQMATRYKHVHVVEVHDAFLGHGLHARHWWESHFDWRDPHCWLYQNIEDPNERGYDAIRRLILNKINGE